MVVSTKPRWLRHMTATLEPWPTPASRSACASAFVRRWTSANVSVPRSSTIAVAVGWRIALTVYPAAGVGPKRCSASTALATLSGRVGVATPAPTSVFAVNSFCRTRSVTFTGRKPIASRQGQIRRGVAALDEGVDVARAARGEEHMALADARLLRKQAGLEQRLPDRLGQVAVVAGEAAREVLEVRVVAAPLPHAVEPLEDAPGDAASGVRVVVRAGDDAGRGGGGVEQREDRVLVFGERGRIGRAAAEPRDRRRDEERVGDADRRAQVLGVVEDEPRHRDGPRAQAVDARDLALERERHELGVGRVAGAVRHEVLAAERAGEDAALAADF